jgi:hypothetical protein
VGVILKGVSAVPWGKLHVASGTAEGVPNLLSPLAWGKESAAVAALEELQFSIFRDGLAVSEATEHVIPFLWEIAGVRRGVVCVEIIRLLDCILVSGSWGKAYADAPRRYEANYVDKVAWERNSHRRVCGGLDFVRTLRESGDEDVAQAAALLEEHIMTEIAAAD